MTAPLASAQNTDAQKTEEEKKRDNQVVCKSTASTGSRVRRTKVCMTRWEAKLEADRARDDADRIRSRSQPEGGPTPF